MDRAPIAIFIASIVLVASCAHKNSKTRSDNNRTITQGSNSIELAGTWARECDKHSFGTTGQWSFHNDQASFVATVHVSDDCLKPLYSSRIEYKILRNVFVDGSTSELDLEIIDVFKTPESSDGASFLNSRESGKGSCLYGEWKKGVEIKLTTLNCGELAELTSKWGLYRTYQIEAGKILRFGKLTEEKNGSSRELIATQLDSVEYSKK